MLAVFGIIFLYNEIARSVAYEYDIPLLMPAVKPEIDEQYLCTAVKLNGSTNIVGYTPQASSSKIHHIIIYGCNVPGRTQPGAVWSCGGPVFTGLKYQWGAVCSTHHKETFYAWALDAEGLRLPRDTAFIAGGQDDVQYLVLQVHYLRKQTEPDNSGIIVHATTESKPRRAGMIVSGTGGQIESFNSANFDTTCPVKYQAQKIYPFAYRVHTHYLGRKVEGYIYRDGVWTLIGQRNPQLPQIFDNAAAPNGTVIDNGDTLLFRCNMFNFRQERVRVGYRSIDEMCNYYVLYHVDASQPMPELKNCFSSGPPLFSWRQLQLKNAPPDL